MTDSPPDHLARFCAFVRVSVSEAAALPSEFVQKTAAQMAKDPADEAAIYLAVSAARAAPPEDTEKTLANFFLEKERREHEPWRVAAGRARVQHESFAESFSQPGAFEELRRQFLARARAQLLSPLESVVLQYLLCAGPAPDYMRYVLASLLLCVAPGRRVELHNWGVHASLPEARRDLLGPSVARCSLPLFPAEPGFDTLNARLLEEAPAGGGGQGEGVYARQRPGEQPFPPTGGGMLAILAPDGSAPLALETGPLEMELAALRAEVADVRAQLGRRGGYAQGRPPPYYQQAPGQRQQQRPQQQTQQPQQQRNGQQHPQQQPQQQQQQRQQKNW